MRSPVPLPPRDRLRWLGLVLYGLVFVVAVRSWGIPFERPILLAWLMGAAAIATIGRRGGGPVAVLRDWLPYGLALTAYDFTRGAADDLGMPVQVRLPIDLDRILGLGHVPTVVLQRWLGGFDGPVAWWEVPMALVYTSHFVAPFVIPAVLWVRNRDRFAAWRDRFFTVVGLGPITYTLVPVAPPWMAARRRAAAGRAGRGCGWSRLGLHVAQSVFDFGNRTVNVVAALPLSLHAAFAAITAVFFWRGVRPWPARCSRRLPPVHGVHPGRRRRALPDRHRAGLGSTSRWRSWPGTGWTRRTRGISRARSSPRPRTGCLPARW
ncbi:MAG: phosphatase PAP2 family protein [Ilumatobacteraceae bacterium]